MGQVSGMSRPRPAYLGMRKEARMRHPRVLLAAVFPAAVGVLAAVAQEHHHPPSPPAGADYADMGRHMRVTVKRAERAGDRDRALRLVEETRRVIEPYRDHRKALEDGFQPFLAQLPLPEYHFTN